MGSEKQSTAGTTTNVTNTSTTPTMTPEEREMLARKNRIDAANEPGQTEMYKNAFSLGNQLLTSFGDKGGQQWQSLIGGVNQDQQNSMVRQSMNMLAPQMQQGGLLDSGTAASVMGRAGADLYNANAQFNVGALQNALNLALSGQAQVQSPALNQSSQLAQSLAGLRSVNTSGTSSGTSSQSVKTNKSFFDTAFMGGVGTGLGAATGKGLWGY